MICAEFHLMYGFQAVISILLSTMLVAIFRIVKGIGRLDRGQLEFNEKIDKCEQSLAAKIDAVEQPLNTGLDTIEPR